MALIISRKVMAKLASKDPPVSKEEIEQCFVNRTGGYLMDLREEHASDPPTRWFIAETHFGRKLKVAFIPTDEDIVIRSAFEPNAQEISIYLKFGS